MLGTIAVRFDDPTATANFYEISAYQARNDRQSGGLQLDVRGNAALAAEEDSEFSPPSLVFSDKLFNGRAFELRASFMTNGYVSHIGGFLSVFDAHAISDVRLVKGGFPARYGGRLSSVLDVRLKEGNKQKLSGSAGIGVLATHFTLEGPLRNGKTTFLVSARRGNLDLFSRLASWRSSGGNSVIGYSFYDASAKVSHQLTEKDQVFAAVYLGGDRFFIRQKPQTIARPQGDYRYQGASNLRYGNALASLR